MMSNKCNSRCRNSQVVVHDISETNLVYCRGGLNNCVYKFGGILYYKYSKEPPKPYSNY